MGLGRQPGGQVSPSGAVRHRSRAFFISFQPFLLLCLLLSFVVVLCTIGGIIISILKSQVVMLMNWSDILLKIFLNFPCSDTKEVWRCEQM